MIEIPRAALLADEIAHVAEFFSFGTNDLTQMGMGLSGMMPDGFCPSMWMRRRPGFLPTTRFKHWMCTGWG